MKSIWAGILALSCAFAMPTVLAAEIYQEGKDYIAVGPQPVEGDKILVEEFFWYGCPHCNKLEPYIAQYVKKLPPNVRFARVPAPAPSWRVQAQAYYAFEQLGVIDKTHAAFFDA